MNEAFEQALEQIEDEKGISREEILSMIEASLAAAFRKDYGQKDQNIVVEFNPEHLRSSKVHPRDSSQRLRGAHHPHALVAYHVW